MGVGFVCEESYDGRRFAVAHERVQGRAEVAAGEEKDVDCGGGRVSEDVRRRRVAEGVEEVEFFEDCCASECQVYVGQGRADKDVVGDGGSVRGLESDCRLGGGEVEAEAGGDGREGEDDDADGAVQFRARFEGVNGDRGADGRD